jgi:hypothetical protein
MKYANAISPERRNATGRVKRPTRSRAPPSVSRTPATPGNDRSDAVPPPGRTAAGNAKKLGGAELHDEERSDDPKSAQ